MKSLYAAICIALITGLAATGAEPMKNVLEDIPYTDGQMGKRQLVDEPHLLVMQVALQPGQQVPPHDANSNVHLLIIEGQVVVTLNGNDTAAAKGTLLPVAIQTPMSIRNDSRENASFLIFKSPHPSEISP
jgi:quercetin dioxygenase-like cupin family protein